MRSLLVACAAGLIAALVAHQIGVLLIVLGLVLVVAAVPLTLTVIGAIVGIPLFVAGALAIALGAVGAGGSLSAFLLGSLVALMVYLRLSRSEGRSPTRA